MDKMQIVCGKCKFYYVTHDISRPWGCRKFRFKSKSLPNQEVKQATGMDCAYFTEKKFMRIIERQSNGN